MKGAARGLGHRPIVKYTRTLGFLFYSTSQLWYRSLVAREALESRQPCCITACKVDKDCLCWSILFPGDMRDGKKALVDCRIVAQTFEMGRLYSVQKRDTIENSFSKYTEFKFIQIENEALFVL